MPDLSLAALSPYISFGGVILAIVTWGRSLTDKLDRMESNHLTHIQDSGEKTVALLIEIKAILEERRR